MNDEAAAQEIQGTVVSPGRFPEPAADQADVSDPEDQEDQEAERPDAADTGYGRVAADRGDEGEGEDELVDPDAVIIAEVAETAAAVDHDAAEAATVPGTDVIAEAARLGVPHVAGAPKDSDAPSVSGLAGDPAQLHERWLEIQSSFVDDPRTSVSAAAELVGEAIAALVAGIQERERALRADGERDGADTEDLRNTLRGYRGLLDQIAAR